MLVLRKATLDDCDFLASLFYNAKYARYFPEGSMTPARWKVRFPEIENMNNFIVLDTLRRNNTGIGWILYENKGEVCHLHRLVMRADLMETGLGFYALEVLMNHLEPEIKTVRLSVHNRNEHAIAFFTRYGFNLTGETEQQIVHGETVDHVIMTYATPKD